MAARRGPRSAEARRIIRELDGELEAASKSTGRQFVWTAQDRVVLDLIGKVVDRTEELREMYRSAEETKMRLKVSVELRLAETHLTRLVKQIQTALPRQNLSRRSQKAQAAVLARWDRDNA